MTTFESRIVREAQVPVILAYAHAGFHGKVIAEIVGCTVHRVYTVVSGHGFSLLDYRNGQGPMATRVMGMIKDQVAEYTGKVKKAEAKAAHRRELARMAAAS